MIPYRVIAVDDNAKHLAALAQGLGEIGAACFQVHFKSQFPDSVENRHVRIMFMDLHLTSSGIGMDPEKHFGVLQALIRKIKPSGPYLVVLWTQYPKDASGFLDFLKRDRSDDMALPFAVLNLDKMNHLKDDETLKDPKALAKSIRDQITTQPGFSALLSWESRVLEASADVASDLVKLSDLTDDTGLEDVLRNLAVAAAGRQQFASEPFRAVNEALSHALIDRIEALPALAGEKEMWTKATGGNPRHYLERNRVGRINSSLLLSFDTVTGLYRGAVIDLPQGTSFEEWFGSSPEETASRAFDTTLDAKCRWLLIQIQPPCDFAQGKPGPIPFVLSLECAPAQDAEEKEEKENVWTTVPIAIKSETRVLKANLRMVMTCSAKQAAGQTAHYRLRNQLLNDLTQRVHSHGARLGYVELRAKPPERGKAVSQSPKAAPNTVSQTAGKQRPVLTDAERAERRRAAEAARQKAEVGAEDTPSAEAAAGGEIEVPFAAENSVKLLHREALQAMPKPDGSPTTVVQRSPVTPRRGAKPLGRRGAKEPTKTSVSKQGSAKREAPTLRPAKKTRR